MCSTLRTVHFIIQRRDRFYSHQTTTTRREDDRNRMESWETVRMKTTTTNGTTKKDCHHHVPRTSDVVQQIQNAIMITDEHTTQFNADQICICLAVGRADYVHYDVARSLS